MKYAKFYLLSFTVFITIAVFFYFWERPRSISEIDYEIYTVQKGDVVQTVLASGVLLPSQFVKVGAQVNGQIQNIFVTEGQKVNKGELLVEIDPTLAKNEVKKAEIQLKNASFTLKLSDINLKRSQLEFKRQKKLSLDNAGIRKDMDDALFSLKEAEIQYQTNQLQLQQAEMDLESSKAKLNYTRIFAPIDGEVLGIIASQGQTIVSSQNSPTLIVLANISTMKVNISVNEVDVRKIKVGQEVFFNATSNNKKIYKSHVKFLQKATSNFLNSERNIFEENQTNMSSYYSAGFEIINSYHELLPSMTVDANIVIERRKSVLRIPNRSLILKMDSGENIVNVKNKDIIERKKIITGLTDGIYSEVISGLVEGEEIVLSVNNGA
ncbi:efflux RND transporter periplasmic adaptor subunit [Aeromonas jandaei]|uniref:efflux RND transporter periplasmic adaptor subunit n=1 Tax=Aeromonas jandaei TaxID=650 RepID=UPI000CE1C3EC|nr:efflux RND transporter periplasmic adaptor subunit [Aeromonas jandaei]PPA27878.1 efflux RND transporter periplasmic adaptor subunit [Aeromonas jandaei]